MKARKTIRAYKGLKTDMTCRGFQYAEGQTFKTDREKVCECGFHACKYPLECFSFYDPSKSIYHEVEISGKIGRSGTKLAATEIKIGRRLSIHDLVDAAISMSKSHVKNDKDSDAAVATGCRSVASATGFRGVASATGEYGAAMATGDFGVASATGELGAVSATG